MSAGPVEGRMHGRLHVLPLRVYYEDTDFSGRVYHAAHLRFFERGRTEFMRATGCTHGALAQATRASGFSVVALEARYAAPVGIDATLQVCTWLERRRGARLEFAQALRRDECVVAEARVQVAPVWLDGGVRRPEAEERLRWDRLAGENCDGAHEQCVLTLFSP